MLSTRPHLWHCILLIPSLTYTSPIPYFGLVGESTDEEDERDNADNFKMVQIETISADQVTFRALYIQTLMLLIYHEAIVFSLSGSKWQKQLGPYHKLLLLIAFIPRSRIYRHYRIVLHFE